jgi:hypothetical protein
MAGIDTEKYICCPSKQPMRSAGAKN